MRVNVYTEEMYTMVKPLCEIAKANYVSSRTGKPTTNYGLRFFLRSSPDLHYDPPRDDDRSAVTFWCGNNPQGPVTFLREILSALDGK